MVQEISHLRRFRLGARAMSDTFRVEEFSDNDFPRALSVEWDDFERRAEQCFPFTHPAYVSLWWDLLGESTRPFAVIARKDGQLVGYAPFVETVDPSGLLPVPVIRFMGNNIGRPGDIWLEDIATVAPHAPIIRAILSRVKAHRLIQRWDLGYLPPWSPTWEVLAELLSIDNRPGPDCSTHVLLELPANWDEYFQSLSPKRRRKFSRQLRGLQDHGGVRVCLDDKPEIVSRRVEEMIRNHDRWWQGTPREGWFGGKSVRRFLTAEARLLASQGRYLTMTLELDETPIAWVVGVCDGKRFFDKMTSFDRELAPFSPGITLLIMGFQHLISRGIRHVDLGPGMTEKKLVVGGRPVAYAHAGGYPSIPEWLRKIARIRSVRKTISGLNLLTRSR